ncbi:MAG: hypothetical protein ACI92Z_000785 [Paracoccaceae bacterium]|jgi:hypothetical protein
MSIKVYKCSKITPYTAILAAFLTAGLSACQQVPQEGAVQEEVIDDVNVGVFDSPKGAVAPEGIDEITSETTPDEVIKILSSRYQRIHHPQQDKYPPVTDGFLYKEDEVTKYIDIWYLNGRVGYVRYGYQEWLLLE